MAWGMAWYIFLSISNTFASVTPGAQEAAADVKGVKTADRKILMYTLYGLFYTL